MWRSCTLEKHCVSKQIFTIYSRGSQACMCVCVCDSVCVCPHDKTKMAEITITELGTGIVHYDTVPTN